MKSRNRIIAKLEFEGATVGDYPVSVRVERIGDGFYLRAWNTDVECPESRFRTVGGAVRKAMKVFGEAALRGNSYT